MFCALNGRRRHSMHLDAGDGPFPRRHRASGQLGRLPRIAASASLLWTLLCLFFRQDYAEVLSQPESYPSQHQAVMQGMTHLLGSSGGEGGGGLPGIQSGMIWRDTEGEVIQAHGGGVLYHSGTYYWYGENKAGPTYQPDERYPARVDVIGVSCYSSANLVVWENRGVALPFSADITSDLHPSRVVERPKVIFNESTKKFVMWMHIDSAMYDAARAGVAVSDSPDGPFEYKGSFQPHRAESRDLTVFKDDDGVGYLIYSSEDNMVTHISELNASYTGVNRGFHRVFINLQREAPAVFKHEGLYFILTSGCSGWWPNAAQVHVAQAMAGPWKSLGNPCRSSNVTMRETTFESQGNYVLPLPQKPGQFIFMADRWNEHHLGHSRYVWLPMSVSVPPAGSPQLENAPAEDRMQWTRVSIQWKDAWIP